MRRDHLDYQVGMTMLEVLIAMLVLSFGALGMISLGTIAARDQQLALFHHRAVAAADDLLARVRANPGGIAAYAGDPVAGQCSSSGSAAIACTPAAMAAHDLFEWRAHHLAGLPSGTAEILFDPGGAPPGLRIAIGWSVRGSPQVLTREWQL